jgi:hypothetical protein
MHGEFLPPRKTSMKSPGLAPVLSFFFCEFGQMYNGQILKGLFYAGRLRCIVVDDLARDRDFYDADSF